MSSFVVEPASKPLLGVARIPGDKSIGHRALLFGALASGEVSVRGLSGGEDNRRSLAAIEALGASVQKRPSGELVIGGVGVDGLRGGGAPIDCGNSGTTIRLLCGILAGQSFATELRGDESLSARPMRRVIGPLEDMGARIRGTRRGDDVYPPLVVEPSGGLRGIAYEQPVASAQVKSAILLAGLWAEGTTEVREPARSRDHTERMLAQMGAPIAVDGERITIDPAGWNRRLEAVPFAVPGDPSAAAFLVVAGLVAGVERVAVADVCVNRRRTGFLDALESFGALVEQECWSEAQGEPTADVILSRGAGDDLQGTTIAGDLTVRAIDELPILSVVAARASGTTHFKDAGELRVKESDRIATTCAMLGAFGVEVEESQTEFKVHGTGGRPLKACEVDARGDHRIAMSAAVAALGADGPVRIHDVDNVATSFPRFVEVMSELGASIRRDD